MNESFVKIVDVKKAYSGNEYVLNGINLDLKCGEIHCLAGGNGSGKSTLIKIISGVHEPSGGEVYIDGEKMTHMKPLDAIDKGIQVIYQDFAVFSNLSVAENIAMNRAIKNKCKIVNYQEMRKLARESLAKIGVEIDVDARLGDLGVSFKQMVALCRALINEPKLLILDEPTTALTAREVEKLWQIVTKLRDTGMAVLLIDHKFDEIKEISDRLTVIRNGEVVSTGTVDEYDHRRFQIDLTGHDFATERYRPAPSDENILTVENISSNGNYENISFQLNKGDVLGITGLLGSGRNEIVEALFGITPAESGRIILNGKEIKLKSIKDAVKNEIGFVPEDRLSQGLFSELPVMENVTASSLKKYRFAFGLRKKKMVRDTLEYIKSLGIKTSSSSALVKSLSGGNAQKVVLSKWLNTNPKLLLLIGPSVGMDVGAKAEIHSILHRLAENGMGIVLVTDDLAELTENCNKILIVRNGIIVKETDNSMSKKQIELLMLGGEEEIV
ncbi:MAG TPA: lipase [Ruminococcaceae bacterium]|nr:lipase [Oscillospiraceae bacterium]